MARALLPRKIYDRFLASDLGRRLARGSAWSLIGSAIFRLLVLVGMILVARILGQEEFGALGLVQATLGVIGLFAGNGLGSTATRFVAQHARSDPDRAGRIIGLVYATSAIAILAAATALILASGFIAGTFLDAPALHEALLWGALVMAAQAARAVQAGVWAAFERFDVPAKLNLFEGVLSIVLLVGLTSAFGLNGSLMALAASAAIVWIAGHVALQQELARRAIIVTVRGAWTDRRILLGYALPNVLSNVATTPVLWFTMTLVARDDAGFEGLGLFNAAYQWHGPAFFIPMTLATVAFPILTKVWSSLDQARFATLTRRLYAAVIVLAVPPAIVGAALSPIIMTLYGPGFAEGWPVLAMLFAAAPFHALWRASAIVMFGQDRAWRTLVGNVIWGALLLTLTLILLPGLGVLGFAIAFLCAHAAAAATGIYQARIGSHPAIAAQTSDDGPRGPQQA